MAARRITADIAKTASYRYQDPVNHRGCGQNLGIRRASQTLVIDSVDVVACAFRNGGIDVVSEAAPR
jgi:hypothetical protein